MGAPAAGRSLSCRPRLVLALLGALLLAQGCGRCGGEAPPTARDERVEAPLERKPLELSPLPEPPAVTVTPGAFPGIPSGPLTVVVARPQGDGRADVRPALTFNKPIAALGEGVAPQGFRITPAVDGEWRFIGSSSVEFVPQALLPFATSFEVSVAPGLKAIDGSTLAKGYSFRFDTLAPRLTGTVPESGWRWLPREPTLALVFNQPVRALDKQLRIVVNGGEEAFTIAAVVDVAREQAEKRKQKAPPPSAWGQATRYELKLQRPLPQGASVVVETLTGLRGEQGPLEAAPTRSTFAVAGPMRVTDVRVCTHEEGPCPYGPIVLSSTNEPELASLLAHVRLEPPAVFDNEDSSTFTSVEEGAKTVLSARLRPGTSYQVIVDAGVVDALGQAAPAFRATVQLDDVEPGLRVDQALALVESGPDAAFPVEAVNVAQVRASLSPFSIAQMAQALGDPQWENSVARVSRVIDTASAKNAGVRRPLLLNELFAPGAPRLFHLELSAPEVSGEKHRVMGQVTDLAVHAKLGVTSSLAWVTSVGQGTPVVGAAVRLWDQAGRELAHATSDADGVARLPGIEDLLPPARGETRWRPPFVLASAEKGGDVGVVASTWDEGVAPWNAGVGSSWEGDMPRPFGMVVSERGIYRPGDEVHVKGLLRVRRRGELKAPALDSELELALHAGWGDEALQKLRVPLSRFGTFTGAFRIPEGGKLGWYRVVARSTVEGRRLDLSADFRVEEYRAPRFKVDVSTPRNTLLAGEPLEATVAARYLFGGGMPGAAVEASALRETFDFEPPGNPGFAFGMGVWGFDDDGPGYSSDLLARTRTTVGADGTAKVALGNAEPWGSRTVRMTMEAEVEDVSKQRVANRAVVFVHPSSLYAGVRVPGGFGEVGKPMPIEAIAVDLEGKRVGGASVEIQVARRQWKSIRRRDPDSGRFTTVSEPEEEPLKSCSLKSDAAAAVRCELSPAQPGLHLIDATVTDAAGRKQVTRSFTYVAGGAWVSWQQSDGATIELVADRKRYEPGETARVLIKSPWPEAEALITVEREGISSVRRLHLKGSATAIEVPIDDAAVPNVFVSALLVRGRVPAEATSAEVDPGRPQVRAGWVELPVETRGKRLEVSVDAGKGPLRPGATVKLRLGTKDARGRGVPAEVAVWAVDEAVLRLTDYKVADPVAILHPPRDLSVHLGEPLTTLVRRRPFGEKGRPPGGDGGDDAGGGFRSNFKTTAFFLPSVVTDSSGQAEVEVKLPDDLTTYRVLALAIGEDDRAGLATSEIVVNKPLLALPALPRLARVGDRFSAGVLVHAQQAGDVTVRLEASGLGATETEQRVSLVADTARAVRFSLQAEQAGTATLRFIVKQGAEEDRLEHKLPVLLPVVLETAAVSGDVAGTPTERREEALAPPGSELWPDVGGLEVTLSSTALAGFQESLKQLVEYPYGCLEQQASRLVPFLALRELEGGFGIVHEAKDSAERERWAKWLGTPDHQTPDPDIVTRKTLDSILALQKSDGGFGYWSTAPCSDPWASSYATLALHRADALGFKVDPRALEAARRFLAERVAADALPTCTGWGGGPRRASDVERVFALWTLGRIGKPKPAQADGLFARRDRLPLFGRAMLADLLFVGKRPADLPRARQVLQEVMNGAKETAREVHFEEGSSEWAHTWSSDARTTALMLMTLVDGEPEHPFVTKIARYLQTAQKGGRYRSTQEAAFALMAITELVRAREREAPGFDAKVTLGGKAIVSEDFQGRSLEVVTAAVPLRTLGSAALPLVFEKTGAGVLSYSAVLRYAKKAMPVDAVDRGLAVQRWFEPWTAPQGQGQVGKAYAGDLLRLRVRVASPQARRFVALDVPLPAGLEAVDASLASSARLPTVAGGDEGSDDDEEGGGEGEEGWYWSPFSHTELRDDRVVLFSDELPPGVHAATVAVRATTPGSFVLRPATAEEMYAPEVSGRSTGGSFEVLP